MFKALFKLFFFLFFLAVIVVPAGLFFFGLENEPLITSQKELTTQNIERAKRLIDKHDPRKMKKGQNRTISIQESDMNLAFHYFLSRIPGGKRVGTRVNMEPGTAGFSCTYRLPKNKFRTYLNVSVVLGNTPEKPTVEKVKIGQIVLEGLFARPIMPAALFLLSKSGAYPDVTEAASVVKEYQFKKDQLYLVYEWKPEVAEKLKQKGRDMLISEKDRERLLVYNEYLANLSKNVNEKKTSLSTFIKPVFSFAKNRSESTNEPVLENQAAIVALTVFTLKKPLDLLIGKQEGQPLTQMKKINITLRGRPDLAKHFMLSAAIAATSDSDLANAIGLFKELDDSRGGSGFSFADLLADRSGVRFGETAIGGTAQAKLVQDRISNLTGESDFMPRIDRLPEGMQEMEFKLRYKDLESKEYSKVKAEIERRIAGCFVFK